MFVVFDSNVWISDRGLNSPRAVEGKDFIRSKGATLAVPEVVRLEVERTLRDEMLKNRKTIEDSRRYLATLLGSVDDVALPTDVDIENLVSSLIDDTKVEIRHMPLTVEAAMSSFDKILRKVQPSDKREQFADGVIWANCLELLSETDVWLVSKDKAFFKDYEHNLGLALNLVEEAKQRPNTLRLFSGLEELLQDVRQGVFRVWPNTESN